MPDTPEANRLGCSCPVGANGTGADRGNGKLEDGVRSWTISTLCPLHTDPKFWYSTKAPKI